MQNTDNIEKLFKEKFKNFEANVNPRVWASVESGISSSAGSAAGAAAKFGLGKIIAGAAAVAGIAGSVWYFSGEENNPGAETKPAQAKTEITSPLRDENFIAGNISSENNSSKVGTHNSFQNSLNENNMAAAQNETHNNEVTANQDNSGTEEPVLPYKPKLGNAPKDDKGMSRIDQNYLKAKAAKENAAMNKMESESSVETSAIETESFSSANSESESKPTADITPPNVFSPNGDGYSDVYSVKTENVVSLSVVIYNQKTGELAARWNTLDGSWDGKLLNGSDAPEGVYFISIKAKRTDGTEIAKNGTITLFR